MTALHVVYNSAPDTTGAAIRTRYLVETQARLGVRPVVVSSPFQPPADPSQAGGFEYCNDIRYYRCYNGADPARFMAAGKPWWERAARLAALGGFIGRIRQVARTEGAQVIHAHNLFFCGLAAEAAGRALGLPVIYEVRSLVEEGMDNIGWLLRPAWRGLEGLACRLASHVTVICEGLRGELIRRGLPDHRITVAGNGVDLEAHRPEAECAAGGLVAGYIGTLVDYEGVETLIEAAARLAPAHPGLRLVIVGDGPARPELERRARSRRLDSVVRFTGRVPHERVSDYYREIDLLVLPRRRTRLTDLVTPLKPLEIMAHARPLIASDCGGHRELIVDGVNGLLFPAGDAAALAHRMDALLADPVQRRRLGDSARAWVSRHRSWESQCRPVVELYQRLARGRRRGVLLVAPAPPGDPLGGVHNGVAMLLGSELAARHGLRVWDRSRGRRFAAFAAGLVLDRPRLVHIKSSSGVNFAESAVYAAAGRMLGLRVLLQLHSGDFERWYREQGRAGRWSIRGALRVPTDILVLSDYWKDVVSRLAPGRPVHLAPNGVEIPGQPAAGSPDGQMRVLTIATLGRHKGHFEILEAAARLRGRPIQFLLAGPDRASGRGEGEQVRRLATQLGLDGMVQFPGPVGPHRKAELLESCDVFLLPSRAEGMPNAVLEAMAAGLPVVATPVGALPEMLPDGVLIPVGDSAALAAALEFLLAFPDLRRHLGLRNRQIARQRYAFEHLVRRLDQIYSAGQGLRV